MKMRNLHPGRLAALALAAVVVSQPASAEAGSAKRQATFANPIDLPYRFLAPYGFWKNAGTPFREAADPTVVYFKGEYWLFASHSLGYWRSPDLQRWQFVTPTGYEVGKFAPTAVAIDDKLYLAVSEGVRKIWVTDDPGAGKWSVAAELPAGYQDPDLFLDGDGRLYIYDGLAPAGPLHVAELDKRTFLPIRKADIAQSRDKDNRGWEVPGDFNELTKNPSYIEGSWMTKHGGRYYLEYSGPGTEFKTYANGVLTAKDPMGPFSYEPYSPGAAKRTGFIGGAGHGSKVQGPGGQCWHFGTMTISVRHIFERRLSMFPCRFTRSGELFADTYLGDYPRYYGREGKLVGWMLLSRNKPASASSALAGFAPAKAADEDVRTWWSADSGKAGEWFQLDLLSPKTIQALQINFADQDATTVGASEGGFSYEVEGSLDGKAWQRWISAAETGQDTPHAYRVLPRPRTARYVRIRNVQTPNGARFSLYDLRIFGNSSAPLPPRVSRATGQRDPQDGRRATFEWDPVKGADFYVVRFGVRSDLMIQNYQVYDSAKLEVRSLNADVPYVFTVDAVNERGVTKGRFVGKLEPAGETVGGSTKPIR